MQIPSWPPIETCTSTNQCCDSVGNLCWSWPCGKRRGPIDGSWESSVLQCDPQPRWYPIPSRRRSGCRRSRQSFASDEHSRLGSRDRRKWVGNRHLKWWNEIEISNVSDSWRKGRKQMYMHILHSSLSLSDWPWPDLRSTYAPHYHLGGQIVVRLTASVRLHDFCFLLPPSNEWHLVSNWSTTPRQTRYVPLQELWSPLKWDSE